MVVDQRWVDFDFDVPSSCELILTNSQLPKQNGTGEVEYKNLCHPGPGPRSPAPLCTPQRPVSGGLITHLTQASGLPPPLDGFEFASSDEEEEEEEDVVDDGDVD